jgi:hypothetical protein
MHHYVTHVRCYRQQRAFSEVDNNRCNTPGDFPAAGIKLTLFTSAIGRYHADSDVVGSTRYSTLDDPRAAEKEPLFLFSNWRR